MPQIGGQGIISSLVTIKIKGVDQIVIKIGKTTTQTIRPKQLILGIMQKKVIILIPQIRQQKLVQQLINPLLLK